MGRFHLFPEMYMMKVTNSTFGFTFKENLVGGEWFLNTKCQISKKNGTSNFRNKDTLRLNALFA